jgi:hypothetical protein
MLQIILPNAHNFCMFLFIFAYVSRYKSGRHLFDILASVKPPVSLSQFLHAGCLFGYSEYEVLTFLKKNELTMNQSLTFEVLNFLRKF